jgi:hypothetical protein
MQAILQFLRWPPESGHSFHDTFLEKALDLVNFLLRLLNSCFMSEVDE